MKTFNRKETDLLTLITNLPFQEEFESDEDYFEFLKFVMEKIKEKEELSFITEKFQEWGEIKDKADMLRFIFSLDLKGFDYNNILLKACINGDIQTVKDLLALPYERGVDPSAERNYCISVAIVDNNYELSKLLIDHGRTEGEDERFKDRRVSFANCDDTNFDLKPVLYCLVDGSENTSSLLFEAGIGVSFDDECFGELLKNKYILFKKYITSSGFEENISNYRDFVLRKEPYNIYTNKVHKSHRINSVFKSEKLINLFSDEEFENLFEDICCTNELHTSTVVSKILKYTSRQLVNIRKYNYSSFLNFFSIEKNVKWRCRYSDGEIFEMFINHPTFYGEDFILPSNVQKLLDDLSEKYTPSSKKAKGRF